MTTDMPMLMESVSRGHIPDLKSYSQLITVERGTSLPQQWTLQLPIQSQWSALTHIKTSNTKWAKLSIHNHTYIIYIIYNI